MNKTYRLIWSEARQAWIVASELANARGKPSSRVRPAVAVLAGALASFSGHAQVPAPNALPTGGQVVGGQASIATSGATMNIQQSTQRAIVNWQSFNIGANATVNFQQPNASAVALNRVLGADPSAIYGNLNANGQVFLLNPSGVVFGPGARVDVGGLVASTLNIRNEDFLSGHLRFTRDGAAGSVINQGDLFGRYVALLAPEVRNEGVIVARQGAAALAASDAVTLNIAGSSLVGVQVDKASINTLVENRRLIQADEGLVILSAQSANALVGRVVNTGTVQAGGISTDGGVVRLVASSAIEHSGSISADAGTNGKGGSVILLADLANPASRTEVSGSISAKGGSQSGDGGFIETSASRLKIADSARIDTSAPFGATGQWLLDPYDFTIAAANGDMSGATLSAALASNNVTIQTSDNPASCAPASCSTGNSSGNGDIFVNDAVSWSSNRTLTLSAWRNIHINAPINVNSTGGLALKFAQSADTFSFPAGIYTVSAPVNLAAGASFSTQAANDGPVINYTVIRDAAALANIASDLAGSYVLGTDVAAPGSSWTPLGNATTPFMGIFDGLGHKITGLQHTNSGSDINVGLFGKAGFSALIQNVGVTGVNIAGSQNVGALVGYNDGFVSNSYATGIVQGTGTGSVGRIGGLIGFSMGPIFGSYADVTVTATSGTQSGNPLTQGQGGIGGLAGVVATSVNDSYARGAVAGGNFAGGLVGYTAASINNSYSTGAVTASTANVGGFAGGVDYGFNAQFIFNSFWDTQTSGRASGGGSTDTSTGDAASGGLIGRTTTQMQNPSTFTGAGWDTTVAWELRSGQYPLLKQMLQPVYVIADNITTTYNGSAFTAFTNTIGPTGTPGGATTGSVTYTPSTASPTNAGTYTVTPGGVTVATLGDQHGYRVEFVNGTLTIDPASLSTTLNTTASKTYDGSNIFNNTHSFTFAGMINSDPMPSVTGGQATVASKNAGTYTSFDTNTLTLSDANYTLTGGTVSATINPKALTLIAPNVSKTYDGGLLYTTQAGDLTALSSQLVSGDTVTAATIAYTNKNAGSGNKTVNFTAQTIDDGNSGGNYTITRAGNSSSTINKADLTLGGSRVYDATTTVAGSVLTATGVNGESFTMTGAGDASNLASKNASTTPQALATVTGLSLGTSNGTNPADSNNYNPVTITGSAVTINKLTLAVSAAPVPSASVGAAPLPPSGTLFKTYDGNSVATVTGVSLKPTASAGTAPADRPYFNDVVTLNTGSASGQFRNGSNVATANVADATTVVITGLALTGADSGNYELAATTTLPGAIQQRTVTLSATKTYDGTTALTGNQVTIGNLVGGESLTHTGATANSKNVGSGNFINAITLQDGTGGLASNYRRPTTLNNTSAPVTIDKADLALIGTRVYDATTVVAGGVLTATGVNGESFAMTGAGDATNLASRNASTTPQALATLTGLSLGTSNGTNPADSSNYNTITITGSAVTITKKTLDVWTEPNPSQIGGITPAAGTLVKIYDGNSNASLTTVFSIPALALKQAVTAGTTFSGQPYSGDDVSIDISGASGQFRNASNVATANVTEATTVALSGLALGGLDSGNYQLPASPTLAGQIRPKTVTLSATKTYDGTTALSGSQVTIGTVIGENLTYTGATASSKNVGAGNFINAITLQNGTGGLASNYQLPTLNNTNAPVTIDPKAVVLSVANVSKIYDATLGYTTTADNLSALSSQLGVSGDAVTAATIAYTDRNAGAGNRTVTLDAVTINNGNGNYSLTLQGNSTSTITPKALSVLGITGVPTPLGTVGNSAATVGQQFSIPTPLSGSPALQTAIAPGTGTATDGKPYDIDGTLTLSGTPSANTWTATASSGGSLAVTAPVTGLALAGTGSTNYTVTGTSVSSSINVSGTSDIFQQRVDRVVNQNLSNAEKPPTTTPAPTTTTTQPTTTTTNPSTTTTEAPPPAQVQARTTNPTPQPGQSVPIVPSSVDGQAVLDPTKPVSAVLVSAAGDDDIPMPVPKITQNANGTITIDVTVPPSTPPGVYIIAVVGTDAKGQSRAVIVPVVVRRRAAA